MKIFLYLLCLPLLFAACGGDDEATPSKESGNCLRVELDGELFETETATIQRIPTVVDSSGFTIQSQSYTVVGIKVNGLATESFSLVFGCIQLRDQEESDPFASDCGLGASYNDLDPLAMTGEMYESDGISGQLNITRLTDTRVEGTFSFDLEGGNNTELQAREGFFSLER